MSVNVYLSGDPVHDRVLRAFASGCPENTTLLDVRGYQPSDVAVVFGVFKSQVPLSEHRGKVIVEQAKARRRTVILETGYIHRGDGEEHYYAAGFGGLNGRADFRNQNSPGDRWEQLGISLKPWRYGDKVLLAAQVPWDASVDHVDYMRWLFDTSWKIQARTKRPLVFRPHPKAGMPCLPGFEYSNGGFSWDDIYATVTFSSNMALEGLLEGVPAFVDDLGAMTLPVANRGLENLNNPVRPDRTQWAYDLAYTQWTPQEMREGLSWKHLFR